MSCPIGKSGESGFGERRSEKRQESTLSFRDCLACDRTFGAAGQKGMVGPVSSYLGLEQRRGSPKGRDLELDTKSCVNDYISYQ